MTESKARGRILLGAVGAAIALILAPIVGSIVDDYYESARDRTRTALGGPVLDIAVTYNQQAEPYFAYPVALPGPLDPVPAPGAAGDGLRTAGAVPLGIGRLTVTVRGVLAEQVVIEDIRVRVVEVADAYAGTLVVPPNIGGHPLPRIQIGFDLEQGDARAQTLTADGLGAAYFDTNTVAVARDEKLSFALAAYAREHRYRWQVEFHVEVGGEVHIVPVTIDGGLTVTGAAASYAGAFVWDENDVLRPVPPAELCTPDCGTALDSRKEEA